MVSKQVKPQFFDKIKMGEEDFELNIKYVVATPLLFCPAIKSKPHAHFWFDG
jgi:hypothetical protein